MDEPHVFVRDLQPGALHGIYQVSESRVLKTRNGKPYLALSLRDNSGTIGAKRWDVSEAEAAGAKTGSYLELQGEIELYRNVPQLIVRALRPAAPEDVDPELFATRTTFDPAQLATEVRELLVNLPDEDLRRVAQAYLDDSEFMARFEVSPAAERMHHPYRFGLLEHVHSVMTLGEKMCEHYSWLDRSLVLLGLFLHDSGKVVELVGEETPGYSTEGELLGHITIGINMLDRKLQALGDIPPRKGVLLKHIILSHHGQAEFGSPKPTMVPEALLVHAIEMLDAKLNAFQREQAEPPEHSDALGGVRYSKLLRHKVISSHPGDKMSERADAPD
ncbi:MAG: HD domain-containing protein [Planctomycetes bacterium]|nr:HD domain-containing protein [Planctomycetota bacterium]